MTAPALAAVAEAGGDACAASMHASPALQQARRPRSVLAIAASSLLLLLLLACSSSSLAPISVLRVDALTSIRTPLIWSMRGPMDATTSGLNSVATGSITLSVHLAKQSGEKEHGRKTVFQCRHRMHPSLVLIRHVLSVCSVLAVSLLFSVVSVKIS
jgi:hypothetical protein